MKIFKQMFGLIVNILSKPFYFLASLASLIGFFIVFYNDSTKVIIALSFFCFLLLSLIGTLIYTMLKLLDKSHTDFESKSTFIKYETLDGNNITYEAYKLMQCKRPILSEYHYNFKWSGTHMPNITSNLQTVINVLDDKNPSNYDKAILKFKKPLTFNESCVIHFKSELDDTDKQSNTYVSNRILRSVDVIHYRIILKYKSENSNAVLERKKNDSVSQDFEKLKEIPYDSTSKSYEYHLLNPDLGYIYRIRWNR